MVKGFTTVSNDVVRDTAISARAKGVFLIIKGKPPGWNFCARRLSKESSEGRDAIHRAIQELEAAGYLSRKRLSTGRMEWKTIEPHPENPSLVEPHPENPSDGKSVRLKTRPISNTIVEVKNRGSKESELNLSSEITDSDQTIEAQLTKLWNEQDGLCRCLKFNAKRTASLKARLKDPFWRENWQTAVSIVGASEFCTGKKQSRDGGEPWRANIEWFLRTETLTRIIEGQYGLPKKQVETNKVAQCGPEGWQRVANLIAADSGTSEKLRIILKDTQQWHDLPGNVQFRIENKLSDTLT